MVSGHGFAPKFIKIQVKPPFFNVSVLKIPQWLKLQLDPHAVK